MIAARTCIPQLTKHDFFYFSIYVFQFQRLGANWTFLTYLIILNVAIFSTFYWFLHLGCAVFTKYRFTTFAFNWLLLWNACTLTTFDAIVNVKSGHQIVFGDPVVLFQICHLLLDETFNQEKSMNWLKIVIAFKSWNLWIILIHLFDVAASEWTVVCKVCWCRCALRINS